MTQILLQVENGTFYDFFCPLVVIDMPEFSLNMSAIY